MRLRARGRPDLKQINQLINPPAKQSVCTCICSEVISYSCTCTHTRKTSTITIYSYYSHPILVNEILYCFYTNFIFSVIKFNSADFFNSFTPHWLEIDTRQSLHCARVGTGLPLSSILARTGSRGKTNRLKR